VPDPLLIQGRIRPRLGRRLALEPGSGELRDFATDFAVAVRVGKFYRTRVRREGQHVFFEFTPRQGGRFVARLECQGYPMQAPDLAFLNPANYAVSAERKHWPPNGPVGNHRGKCSICMPGIRTSPGAMWDRALPRILEILALCCNGQAVVTQAPRRR